MSSILGTVVDGRYRVDRIVGEGGFGVVFRAWHLRFHANIALKVLKLPDQATPEVRDQFIQAFESEGRVLFELSSIHPSIVRAMETGVVVTADGSAFPYLVLEWLEGVSLDDELRARRAAGVPPYRVDEAIALLAKPAEAIATAHRHHVAHRDIKPANIFLCRRDDTTQAKVLDFGLAKVMSDVGSTTAMLNASVGGTRSFTPAYGAPEQWLQRLGATGPWTDVYALALVVVELLTGRPALVGCDSAQLMAACLDERMRPTPQSRGVSVPDDVEEVLNCALAIAPRWRFANVGAFWRALCSAANVDPGDEAAVPAIFAAVSPTPLPSSEGPKQVTFSPSLAAPPVSATEASVPGHALRAPEPATRRAQPVTGLAVAAIGALAIAAVTVATIALLRKPTGGAPAVASAVPSTAEPVIDPIVKTVVEPAVASGSPTPPQPDGSASAAASLTAHAAPPRATPAPSVVRSATTAAPPGTRPPESDSTAGDQDLDGLIHNDNLEQRR